MYDSPNGQDLNIKIRVDPTEATPGFKKVVDGANEIGKALGGVQIASAAETMQMVADGKKIHDSYVARKAAVEEEAKARKKASLEAADALIKQKGEEEAARIREADMARDHANFDRQRRAQVMGQIQLMRDQVGLQKMTTEEEKARLRDLLSAHQGYAATETAVEREITRVIEVEMAKRSAAQRRLLGDTEQVGRVFARQAGILRNAFMIGGVSAVVVGSIQTIQRLAEKGAELERVLTRLQAGVERQGASWGDARKELVEYADAESRVTQFSSTELLGALDLLIERGHSWRDSLQVMKVAEDAAVATKQNLASVVLKLEGAWRGNTVQLRTLGVLTQDQIKHGETFNKVLEQTEQRYADAKTKGIDPYDRATNDYRHSLENLEENIGVRLLPELTDVIKHMADIVSGTDKAASESLTLGQRMNTLGGILQTIADGAKEVYAAFADVGSMFERLDHFIDNKMSKWPGVLGEFARAHAQMDAELNSSGGGGGGGTMTGGRLGTLPGGMMEQSQAYQAAVAAGVDPAYFFSLLRAEGGMSRGGKFNVSPVGAIGPGQLMPGTAAGLGVNPWDLGQNLTGSARYFRSLLDKYHGDYSKATAAYNAGPGAVDRFGGVPPYSETQRYVQGIQTDFALHGGSSSGAPGGGRFNVAGGDAQLGGHQLSAAQQQLKAFHLEMKRLSLETRDQEIADLQKVLEKERLTADERLTVERRLQQLTTQESRQGARAAARANQDRFEMEITSLNARRAAGKISTADEIAQLNSIMRTGKDEHGQFVLTAADKRRLVAELGRLRGELNKQLLADEAAIERAARKALTPFAAIHALEHQTDLASTASLGPAEDFIAEEKAKKDARDEDIAGMEITAGARANLARQNILSIQREVLAEIALAKARGPEAAKALKALTEYLKQLNGEEVSSTRTAAREMTREYEAFAKTAADHLAKWVEAGLHGFKSLLDEFKNMLKEMEIALLKSAILRMFFHGAGAQSFSQIFQQVLLGSVNPGSAGGGAAAAASTALTFAPGVPGTPVGYNQVVISDVGPAALQKTTGSATGVSSMFQPGGAFVGSGGSATLLGGAGALGLGALLGGGVGRMIGGGRTDVSHGAWGALGGLVGVAGAGIVAGGITSALAAAAGGTAAGGMMGGLGALISMGPAGWAILAGAGLLGGAAFGMFGHKDDPNKMPDKYATADFGQFMANLGTANDHATPTTDQIANGQHFNIDPGVSAQTGGVGEGMYIKNKIANMTDAQGKATFGAEWDHIKAIFSGWSDNGVHLHDGQWNGFDWKDISQTASDAMTKLAGSANAAAQAVDTFTISRSYPDLNVGSVTGGNPFTPGVITGSGPYGNGTTGLPGGETRQVPGGYVPAPPVTIDASGSTFVGGAGMQQFADLVGQAVAAKRGGWGTGGYRRVRPRITGGGPNA